MGIGETRKLNGNKKRLAAAMAAVFMSATAEAVSIGEDGTGQALVYPYYTTRTVEGGQFHTYISVVNHTARAKAVRVYVREARMGQAVASFNLFLSPNDAWTGAIVPQAQGARLVTSDTSCTEPAFTSLDFQVQALSDGAGGSFDRTREGYVEMLEMATLTGASAAAVTHSHQTGLPSNCAAVQPPAAPQVEAPSGGLSGTLTVIDVLRGMDFTVNAIALDHLATRPYFRRSSDPSADYSAAEIDKVSSVVHAGKLYRSQWARSEDAVTALLMRMASADFVLDAHTLSRTDLVLTMPTRRLQTNAQGAWPPFTWRAFWEDRCEGSVGGEPIDFFVANRGGRGQVIGESGFPGPPVRGIICAAVAVPSISNASAHMPAPATTTSAVLGHGALGFAGPNDRSLLVPVSPSVTNGRVDVGPMFTVPTLTSLPGSTRSDLANGTETIGPHTYYGLPIVGFSVRTFLNGTLDCAGRACQGNFGGSFPFRYRRTLSP